MRFRIAQFGSFRDSNGYTWRIPDGIGQAQLQGVANRFLKTYEDGRCLLSGEVYGGYLIDAAHQMFYAFRFVDGGQDSRGRDGVVITNFAVAPCSEVGGENIRGLFDALIFTQLPESGEINVAKSFRFESPATIRNDCSLNEKEVDSVFTLPVNFNRSLIVQFELKNDERKARIKFLSPQPAEPAQKSKSIPARKERPASACHPPKKKNVSWDKYPYRIGIAVIFVAVLLLIAIPLLRHGKGERDIGLSENKKQGNSFPTPLVRDDQRSNKTQTSKPDSQRMNRVLSFSSFPIEDCDVNSFAVYLITPQSSSWYDAEDFPIRNGSRFDDCDLGNATFQFQQKRSRLFLKLADDISVSFKNDDILSFSVNDSEENHYEIITTSDSWEIRCMRDGSARQANRKSPLVEREKKSEVYPLVLKQNKRKIASISVDSNAISFNCSTPVQIMCIASKGDTSLVMDALSPSEPVIVFFFYKTPSREEDAASPAPQQIESIFNG